MSSLEKPEGIERLLAQLDLVENDKRLFRNNGHALVLGDAPDYSVHVISWPIKNRLSPREVRLEIKLHETVDEALLAHALCEHRLSYASRALNKKGLHAGRRGPACNIRFKLAAHILH